MTPDSDQLELFPADVLVAEPPSAFNTIPIEGLPILDQLRRDNGVTGARARKEAQRLKDSNPVRR